MKLYNIRARIDVSETLSERLVQQVKMRLDERPMSLKELVEQTKVEQKQVYRVLSSLHRSNQIVQFRDPDGVRRYRRARSFTSKITGEDWVDTGV